MLSFCLFLFFGKDACMERFLKLGLPFRRECSVALSFQIFWILPILSTCFTQFGTIFRCVSYFLHSIASFLLLLFCLLSTLRGFTQFALSFFRKGAPLKPFTTLFSFLFRDLAPLIGFADFSSGFFRGNFPRIFALHHFAHIRFVLFSVRMSWFPLPGFTQFASLFLRHWAIL